MVAHFFTPTATLLDSDVLHNMQRFKRYVNNPPHLLLDDTAYFITAAIYEKRRLLARSETKARLLNLLQQHFQRYEWQLQHWVILDNHYHLMGMSRSGEQLPQIFRNVHSAMAGYILELETCQKPVWWNYWDYCPRHEKDYLTRLNYLLYNPVKHGYTTDLHSYPFSSFHALYEQMGRDRLAAQFRAYPEYATHTLPEAHNDDF